MNLKKRKFNQEFIDEAVQLYLTSGKTQAELASELGCPANSISRWVKQHKQREEALRYPNESPEAKIARLERELTTVKQERDILKKSIGIVSKP